MHLTISPGGCNCLNTKDRYLQSHQIARTIEETFACFLHISAHQHLFHHGDPTEGVREISLEMSSRLYPHVDVPVSIWYRLWYHWVSAVPVGNALLLLQADGEDRGLQAMPGFLEVCRPRIESIEILT